MPETVNIIGNYAFSGFLITNSFAFGYCFNLETVIIGENVNTIEGHAFFECYLLTNITIPDSVISIGPSAFQYCDNLTTVIIGKNVTSIGGSAFQCKNLKCIYFTGYQHPIEIDPNSFVDTPAKYVMTSDLYQNITFGNLSVSKGSSIEDCEAYQWPTHPFTNSFSNSDIFTKPNTFSNTHAITKSNAFTKSNTFADLSHFPTTFSFSYILTKTYSITQTLTLHNKFSTHSFTFTYTDSISTYINSQFIYYEYSI